MEYTREELEENRRLKSEVEELRRQLKVFQDKEEERKEKERKRLEKKANKPRRGPGRPRNPNPPKKEPYIPTGRRSIIPEYEKEMIVRMYQNNIKVDDIIKSSGYSRPTVYKILNESKAVNRYKRK